MVADLFRVTAPLSTLVSDLDLSPPKPLLCGRLDPIEATILFGPGGAGKGALACEYIRQLVEAGHTVLILDYEDHGGEWGRRLDGLGADTAGVHWLAPFKRGLGAITDPTTIRAIQAEVELVGATYVVIDSIVVACAGDDVSDPSTPALYAQALQAIGLPSLSLAHVNRAHDTRYPFGSVFWHNLARVTWSLMPKGGDILLTCAKASNYKRPGAFTVTYSWHNDVLREVYEKPAIVTLMDRIKAALADGPLTVQDIADSINDGLPTAEHTKPNNIRAALSRELRARGASSDVTTAGDGKWALRGEE